MAPKLELLGHELVSMLREAARKSPPPDGRRHLAASRRAG